MTQPGLPQAACYINLFPKTSLMSVFILKYRKWRWNCKKGALTQYCVYQQCKKVHAVLLHSELRQQSKL